MQVPGKQKVTVRWVPHFLTAEKKATRSEIAYKLLTHYKNEYEIFLDWIVATDETWIWDFEPEMKSQSDIWKGPSLPRAQKFVTNGQK